MGASTGDDILLCVLHANPWSGYLAAHLFPNAPVLAWRPGMAGTEVAGWLGALGADTGREAALLFHVDLSDTRRTPQGRAALLDWLQARGIACLNAGCEDLSRRRLQARLRALSLNSVGLTADAAARTRVIVKTNPNHGGEAEMRLAQHERDLLGIGFRGAPFVAGRQYKVMPLQEVPAAVAANPDYVIERFVGNRADLFFRAYVSGTAVVVVKAHCASEVKAISGDPRDENWAFHAEDLQAPGDAAIAGKVRQAIHTIVRAEDLHFASLDIVQDDDGEPHVVDLNTTPWGGKAPLDPQIAGLLREGFLQGIERRRRLGGTARTAPIDS